jgi:hypothetical protein
MNIHTIQTCIDYYYYVKIQWFLRMHIQKKKWGCYLTLGVHARIYMTAVHTYTTMNSHRPINYKTLITIYTFTFEKNLWKMSNMIPTFVIKIYIKYKNKQKIS